MGINVPFTTTYLYCEKEKSKRLLEQIYRLAKVSEPAYGRCSGECKIIYLQGCLKADNEEDIVYKVEDWFKELKQIDFDVPFALALAWEHKYHPSYFEYKPKVVEEEE